MAANDVLNLNFKPIFADGAWKTKKLPMKESVAMAAGCGVYTDEAGELTIVDGSSANFVGILMEDIAATDSDYATARKLKLVAVPLRLSAEAEFKVGAGTFTTADEGKSVVFHSDGISLAVDTAGIQARITKYLSATRGRCTFFPTIT